MSFTLKCNFGSAIGKEEILQPFPPKIVWDSNQVAAIRLGLNTDANRKLLEAMTNRLSDPNVGPQMINNTLLVNEAKKWHEIHTHKKARKKKREWEEMV